MANIGDIVQKAFYLGVGVAVAAGETANETIAQIRTKAQKLADELVEKGEMNAEQARRYVDDMIQQAQKQNKAENPPSSSSKGEPRRIEILNEDEDSKQTNNTNNNDADAMRKQVESLKQELERLKKAGK
ncbi:MAG TPA: hypothetical protein V6C58_27450 [Allocoleopsis sp.]